MKKIQTNDGIIFNKIAGDDKKALFYNEKANNLIIVLTDTYEEEYKAISDQVAEAYKTGQIEESPYNAQGVIEIELNEEEFTDTIEDAIGFITEDRFTHLSDAFYFADNSTTLIHKPYHTTTDYILNHGLDPKTLKLLSVEEANYIFKQSLPEEMPAYKIIEIFGDTAYRSDECPRF